MKLRGIPKKVITKVRKNFYVKRFHEFAMSSAIGSDGYGKDCEIQGAERISIGANTWVDKGCELSTIDSHFDQKLCGTLVLGKHVRIHHGSRITAAGSIVLEDNVLIAPEVFITDHNHGMDPRLSGGYSEQPLEVKPVKIGEGSWLGQRVCVMPGVTIGKHCIIGAASVVTHDIPDYCMAVGSPAKVVKKWNAVTESWCRV